MSRTYGALGLVETPAGSRWMLTDLEPHVILRLKANFPKIPKAAGPPFYLPADKLHAMELDWFVDRFPLAASAQDRDALKRGRTAFEGMQAEVGRILAPDYVAPAYAGLKPGMQVRPYQAQAIELLRLSHGLLVGDEVGLGKTFLAAGAFLLPGALPGAVVCLPHLQAQWVRVIETFTTLKAHPVKQTKPYALPDADVMVFRYSQLAGWADYLAILGIGLAAYDEVQELRGGRATAKGMAAGRLSDAALMRLGLTATPIYNYGAEIHTVMGFINAEVLGDREGFVREWNGELRSLGTYLREQRAFLRRTKADVGQHMPPVNKIVDTVEYDVAELRSVEDAARQLALRATTAAPLERGQAARDLDLLMRLTTGVAKADQVAQVVRILVEGGEPVVLVGWHRDVYDIWLSELRDLKPAMYTGSETPGQKSAQAQRFLDGETDVLIMSLRSGAGLDGLQARCSTMVFGELDWSPGIHHQCVGRLDREGQTKPVTAIYLVCDDGSDPPLMEVLGLKASQAHQVVDPTTDVQSAHSDREGLRRLVQRYLDRQGSTERAGDVGAPANLVAAEVAA